MFNVVHITPASHTASGGIGVVLAGLINSRTYRDTVGRTLLVGPLPDLDDENPLGPDGIVEYSALDHVNDGPYATALRQLEQDLHIRLIYGRRPIEDVTTARRTICEVLLFDLRGTDRQEINRLKYELWERFKIESDRFEHLPPYEESVVLAVPLVGGLDALRIGNEEAPAVVLGHGLASVPSLLALQIRRRACHRTVYQAHEVPPLRQLVQSHPGHDLALYNALDAARESEVYCEQVFGPRMDDYAFILSVTARHCDGILAVGPRVVQELNFLAPAVGNADINLGYNGVPAARITLAARQASRARIDAYLERMLGWKPEYVFTHIARPGHGKAFWRDLDVLEAIDDHLVQRDCRGVLLALQSAVPARTASEVRAMEAGWNWPLAHRTGYPDLVGEEIEINEQVQRYNACSRNTRVIYINQFGFDTGLAGSRVPAGMTLLDWQQGTDAAFGLSLYEPFGLAPLTPLTFGAVCVVSTTCGCTGLVRQVLGRKKSPNVILANYIEGVRPRSVREALAVDNSARRTVERKVARSIAEQLLARLPESPEQTRELLQSGRELAEHLSWDAVAQRFIFPALRRACARPHIARSA